MLFKRVSRSNPEVAYIVCKNVSGSTITAGYSAFFDATATIDGVGVTQADTAALQAFAGIADSDVANGDYGLFQVYGYRASAYVYSSAGSSVAGDILQGVDGQWGIQPATGSASSKAFGWLGEAITASASSSNFNTTAKIFVRAL